MKVQRDTLTAALILSSGEFAINGSNIIMHIFTEYWPDKVLL